MLVLLVKLKGPFDSVLNRLFRCRPDFILAAVALSSCAGAGAEFGKHEAYERFGVKHAVAVPATAKDATLVKKESGKNPSRQALITCIGQPDLKRADRGEEIWVWDQGQAYRGIFLMAGLPLPLILPVGRDRMEIHFVSGGDVAVRAVQYRTASDGFMFYPLPGGGGIGSAGFYREKNGW